MHLTREMEAFRAALRAKGLSATHQRLTIAKAAFSTHSHFAADELFAQVRKLDPRVGRVTVYRTLAVMVEAGLVEERQFRKDRVLYEHVIGHGHHDHMVCIHCGRIHEFSSPRIEAEQEAAAEKYRFSILHHSHTLFGTCRTCSRKGAATATGVARGRTHK